MNEVNVKSWIAKYLTLQNSKLEDYRSIQGEIVFELIARLVEAKSIEITSSNELSYTNNALKIFSDESTDVVKKRKSEKRALEKTRRESRKKIKLLISLFPEDTREGVLELLNLITTDLAELENKSPKDKFFNFYISSNDSKVESLPSLIKDGVIEIEGDTYAAYAYELKDGKRTGACCLLPDNVDAYEKLK